MLLKKIQSKFVPLKKRKKGSKATTALPLGRKGRCGFSLYMAAVLALCCFSVPALAAADPLGVVNNLSSFIFSLIRAIGLILLGFGILQVGLSLKSHDPSQRANGMLTVAGGIVITFTKEILNLITG